MRACLMLALLPVIAACGAEPAPQPEPRETPDPVVIKSESDRRVLLAGSAQQGDFKANFGEPFIGFENRGTRMAISQNYEGPSYRIIDVTRSREGGNTVFRAKEGAIPGSAPFVLTISRGNCRNEFSGERTDYVAWLGTSDNPRQTRSCAADAK